MVSFQITATNHEANAIFRWKRPFQVKPVDIKMVTAKDQEIPRVKTYDITSAPQHTCSYLELENTKLEAEIAFLREENIKILAEKTHLEKEEALRYFWKYLL
jgi:hypothetical protein